MCCHCRVHAVNTMCNVPQGTIILLKSKRLLIRMEIYHWNWCKVCGLRFWTICIELSHQECIQLLILSLCHHYYNKWNFFCWQGKSNFIDDCNTWYIIHKLPSIYAYIAQFKKWNVLMIYLFNCSGTALKLCLKVTARPFRSNAQCTACVRCIYHIYRELRPLPVFLVS